MPVYDSAMIGEVRFWSGVIYGMPEGWIPCDGRELPITYYTALFTIIGTYYGGDGRVSFKVPDLRGSTFGGAGQGPNLSPYYLGYLKGSNTRAQDISNMPNHTHPVTFELENTATMVASTDQADNDIPGINYIGAGHYKRGFTNAGYAQYVDSASANADVSINGLQQITDEPSGYLATAGSSSPKPVDNRQPGLVLGFFICADDGAGKYPPRS